MDKTVLLNTSAQQGLQWIFGPGDAPWYQGAAESLIKAVKRCFMFSVGNRRLSTSEFQTVCTEDANTLNERPLGLLPSIDSDISILTPNCQLIRRPFAKNPGQCSSDNSLKTCSSGCCFRGLLEGVNRTLRSHTCVSTEVA